jgi:RES domain-containing protein
MGLAQLVEPVRKVAWVCRPDDLPRTSVLDLRSDRPNRWNEEGQQTIYLSGDPALALIEIGRHPEDLKRASHLLRLDLRLRRALDLRRPPVRAELELPAGDWWILDRDRTRSVAERIRTSGECDGLLVPSAGALDQEDRWNAVVFADDGLAVDHLLGDPRPAGNVLLDDAAVPERKQAG